MPRSQKSMTKRMQRMILKGPIVKTLFVLGWPLMFMQLFQATYGLVDTYWLGKLGVEALGVPGVTWPMVFLFLGLANGLSVAGVALVSQYTGRKNEEEVKKSAGQVFSMLTIVALILSVIGFMMSGFILDWMGPSEVIASLALPYIKLIFTSMPFMFILMIYSGILRGWGDTKTPMYITVFSLVLNMILDPIFIFGFSFIPGMGVTGAGVATLISRIVGAGLCIYFLFYGKNTLTISLSHLRIIKEKAKTIMKIGGPASIGQAMVALGFIFMASFVAHLADPILAAYNIGVRVINMTFMVTFGLTFASAAMIGQNLGAGKPKRAEKILYKTMSVTAIFLLAFSIFLYIFRGPIFGLFTDNRLVLEEGGNMFAIFGFTTLFFGLYSSSTAAFQAGGHTVPIMSLGIIRLWALRVPLCYLLAFTLSYGAFGIWVGMAISNIISATLAVIWVMKGTWKKEIIDKPIERPISQVR